MTFGPVSLAHGSLRSNYRSRTIVDGKVVKGQRYMQAVECKTGRLGRREIQFTSCLLTRSRPSKGRVMKAMYVQ